MPLFDADFVSHDIFDGQRRRIGRATGLIVAISLEFRADRRHGPICRYYRLRREYGRACGALHYTRPGIFSFHLFIDEAKPRRPPHHHAFRTKWPMICHDYSVHIRPTRYMKQYLVLTYIMHDD